MKKKKSQHGGKRSGSGRKLRTEKPLVNKHIRVDGKQWEVYKRKAKRAGISLNAWIRDRLDNAD